MKSINSDDFVMKNLENHYQRIDKQEEESTKCGSCNGVKWFIMDMDELGHQKPLPCPTCNSGGLNDEQ